MIDPRTIGIAKFGQNLDVDLAAAEDLWTQGGTYTFLTTAATMYASSSDALDVAAIVTVIGINAAGLEITLSVVLTGQTQVEIPGDDFLAVYRAYISGATAAVGDIYIATDAGVAMTGGVPDDATKIKAKIDILDQQTMMAITTIPQTVGTKTVRRAWIADMLVTVLPGSPAGVLASVVLQVMEQGGVFRTWSSAGITDAQPIIYRPFPKYIEVGPFAHVKLVGTTDTNDTFISGEFAIFYEITT